MLMQRAGEKGRSTEGEKQSRQSLQLNSDRSDACRADAVQVSYFITEGPFPIVSWFFIFGFFFFIQNGR